MHGVFHKSARIPLMIYDQDQMSMTIHLLPVSYNDGEYFDQQVYLEWIRAYGNFNDYDFFSGEIFQANGDGSISGVIKTDLETIRYQIRGLANGVTVLPGADEYAPLGSDFEALVYNASNADSIELRFHPGDEHPFSHILPEGPASWQVPMDAFVHFHRENYKYWLLPLERVRSSQMAYQPISKPANIEVAEEILKKSMLKYYDFKSLKNTSAFRDSVINDLRRNNLHPQQRSALLISYIGLTEQQKAMGRYIQGIGQEPHEIRTHSAVFDNIFDTVDPRNPVCALNSKAPLILPKETIYSEDAVAYTEQMVRQHADDMVVRHLVLRLIERRADDFEDIRNLPYYH